MSSKLAVSVKGISMLQTLFGVVVWLLRVLLHEQA